MCFGASRGQLDASIVTLTYGGLPSEFHASPARPWSGVSLAYLLTLVTLLVPAGRLADAHGRKLLYLYGFAVFTSASAACGVAPSLWALVVFRVVQAAGAALMQANSMALVTTSAPRERIRAALGVQARRAGAGAGVGADGGRGAAAASGLLVVPLTAFWLVPVLVPTGGGAGYVHAGQQHAITGAVPARSSGTGGGLVNMARGLGTALGVALVTLALHLAGSGGLSVGARWAAAVLAGTSAVAVVSAWPGPRRPNAGAV